MTPAQNPPSGAADEDDSIEERERATPDERGPHDVPDERVIDKTLPSAPSSKPERTSRD